MTAARRVQVDWAEAHKPSPGLTSTRSTLLLTSKVRGSETVAVADGDGVAVSVAVDVKVAVAVSVEVAVDDGVEDGVKVRVMLGVFVGVRVGEEVRVGVRVAVTDRVMVGKVPVGVFDGVTTGVSVFEAVALEKGSGVAVSVGAKVNDGVPVS
jgi:hypothetical protein